MDLEVTRVNPEQPPGGTLKQKTQEVSPSVIPELVKNNCATKE